MVTYICLVAVRARWLRGGELGVLRVREHPLSEQVHPLTAKSTLSKLKKNFVKCLVIL